MRATHSKPWSGNAEGSAEAPHTEVGIREALRTKGQHGVGAQRVASARLAGGRRISAGLSQDLAGLSRGRGKE